MKKTILIILTLTFLNTLSQGQELPDSSLQSSGAHKFIVKEAIQTTSYTYLLGIEDTVEFWMAVPKMEAKSGEVYYYKGGFDMVDFKSTQLKRTFEKVKFLGGVSKTPITTKLGPQKNPHEKKSLNNKMPSNHPAVGDKKSKPSGKTAPEKEIIKLEKVEGTITLAELFKNKTKYEGKTIKIQGKVKKFTTKIMSRNWIHLQDGTEFEGEFDLTVTTKEIIELDKIITIEGKVTLNKDFGYGYKYNIIIEEAKILK